MNGLDVDKWIKDKCTECGNEFLWWYENKFRVCNTCEIKDKRTITRKQFREAMEYGLDNAVMKGNMIDVATNYLFGEKL